jgi:outer membrane autotransporter protein
VPLYEVYPQVLAALNRAPTLQQRIGNRVWSGTSDPQPFEKGALASAPPGDLVEESGLWIRLEGSRLSVDPERTTSVSDYDIDLWGLQAGADFGLHEFANASQLVGGINVRYGRADADVSSPYGDGSIETSAYGVGASLTWYDPNGLYVDGQAYANWFDSDIESDVLQRTLVDGSDGFGYAFSAEIGKSIDVAYRWSVTPQAQIVYSNVDFDTFSDPYAALVERSQADSLLGRLGVSIDHERAWLSAAGDTRRWKGYGLANLYYEFLDGTQTSVGGVDFTSRAERFWGGLGAGMSFNWADDAFSLYGEVGARTPFEDFGDSYAVDGTVGFRAKF